MILFFSFPDANIFPFFSDARLQYYSFFNLDLNGLEGIVRNSSISWKSFLHDPFFLFSRCVTFFLFFFQILDSSIHSSRRVSTFGLEGNGIVRNSPSTKLKIISSRASFSTRFQHFPFFPAAQHRIEKRKGREEKKARRWDGRRDRRGGGDGGEL